ncbi:MAG: DNA polymerase III subunit chi [Natronospirillum sp.]|uniref:DNA polymerase III subunit chi n=1 Tax=Natronospirillum sp. TaxID=2812955 RepID=UPI0025CC2903|nr:DNA polymerase III subunit chi [Natronospirillum sp.]MCH8551619.1 DNA polymerase III subunit chi [Natronospirillum sp.]
MTRIDFHILPCEHFNEAADYVCRLTEKAWKAGHAVLLYCDEEWLPALNDRLWSFRPEAFIPHQPLAEGEARVNLTSDDDCAGHHDIMISLSRGQSGAFSRFDRLIEVVFEDAELKSAKRDHYRFYQERGYPLKNHRV